MRSQINYTEAKNLTHREKFHHCLIEREGIKSLLSFGEHYKPIIDWDNKTIWYYENESDCFSDYMKSISLLN